MDIDDDEIMVSVGYQVTMKAMKEGCPLSWMKDRLQNKLKEERFYEAEGIKKALEDFETGIKLYH